VTLDNPYFGQVGGPTTLTVLGDGSVTPKEQNGGGRNHPPRGKSLGGGRATPFGLGVGSATPQGPRERECEREK